MYQDLLTIVKVTLVTWWIIEGSGFITSLSKAIWYRFKHQAWKGWLLPKPFSCAQCLAFWLLLIGFFSRGPIDALVIATLGSGFVPIWSVIGHWFNILIFKLK